MDTPRLLSLELPCALAQVREACAQTRRFLQEEGLSAEEAGGWELALAEAANNAVNYATPAGKDRPLVVEVQVSPRRVEVRVTDHTPGFDFPEKTELPPEESESGRGLYLMQVLTDEAFYLRGKGENCLVLRKNRATPAGPPPPSPAPGPPSRMDSAENSETLDLMTQELASSYEVLSAIFRFSAEMQDGAHSEDFTARWLAQLLTITGADWYLLRLASRTGKRLEISAASELAFGADSIPIGASSPEDEFVEQRAAARRVDVWFDETTPFSQGDPLRGLGRLVTGLTHPMFLNDNLVGVLTVGRNGANRSFEAGQANVIQTFGDFLGIQIRNARDLEIAAEIQKSLLPERLPEPRGARLASHYRSARQVGGDYYDAMLTGNGNLFLVVADVMGKGVPAAMFASIFRSLVRSRRDLASRPGEFLTWLNRNLAEELGRVDMFITAQLVYVDLQSRQISLASAGHPPMLVAGGDGRVREVEKAGLPAGIQDDEVYTSCEHPLPPGFRLLLYTDGLTEARDRHGNFLGIDKLKDWLGESARRGEEVGIASRNLASLLEEFEKDVALADDQAFILVAEHSTKETQ